MNREELVELFLKSINHSIGNPFKERAKNWIAELLNEGISAEVIEEAIRNKPGKFMEYARAHSPKKSSNILKDGTFYFHPLLQIAPPPAVITINDDGTFSRKEEEFYLKIKNSFTFNDILEHFYKRFPKIERNEQRDLGAIEYLYYKIVEPMIKNTNDSTLNAVDLLLFTIDATRFLCEDLDEELKRILDLTMYMDKGLLIYQDKREGCILAGIDHVI